MEQQWLLQLLKAGVRENSDYRLLSKTFGPKLLLTHWGSCTADRSTNQVNTWYFGPSIADITTTWYFGPSVADITTTWYN